MATSKTKVTTNYTFSCPRQVDGISIKREVYTYNDGSPDADYIGLYKNTRWNYFSVTLSVYEARALAEEILLLCDQYVCE